MIKCIICKKEIIDSNRVILDSKHLTHLDCFYDLVPDAVEKKDRDERSRKIKEIAEMLIKSYDNDVEKQELVEAMIDYKG